MSPEESRIALIELRVRQLETRLKNSRADFWALLGAGLILFPLVFRRIEALSNLHPSAGIALAALIVALGAYVRDRRDDREASAEREQIFLSVSPSKSNP